MLTDIHKVYQDDCKRAMKFAIKQGSSLCLFGPSGAGKTAMAFQSVEEENCNAVYINLSVLERPDFQGWPAPAQGQLIASYATPEFLPFEDTKYYLERKALEKVRDSLTTNNEDHKLLNSIDERIKNIELYDKKISLKKALPYLVNEKDMTASIVSQLQKMDAIKSGLGDNRPNVLLFDESDKAPHEVLQPLLEVTQFHTVNGRPLNIKSCFLLNNLPDEGAHTETLSHALTKRCIVLRLELAFDQWKRWAFGQNIHPLIIGFIANNTDFLHKTDMSKNDPTAYAQPTPRSWEYASNTLYACEKEGIELYDQKADFANDDRQDSNSLTTSLIAGHVGLHAALKLENWVKYYHQLDPTIDAIAKTGVEIGDKLDFTQQLVVALGACTRVKRHLKKSERDECTKVAKNVFTWLNGCQTEVQIGALRGAFDWEEVKDFKLTDVPEVQKVVNGLTDKLS